MSERCFQDVKERNLPNEMKEGNGGRVVGRDKGRK